MPIKSYNEINVYNRYLENKIDTQTLSIPFFTINGKPHKIIINDNYFILFDYVANVVHHINEKQHYKSTDPIFFTNDNTQEVHNYDASTYNKTNTVQTNEHKQEIFIEYTPITIEPLAKSKLVFDNNDIYIQIQEGQYEMIIQFIENNKFYEKRNKIKITNTKQNITVPILYYDYYAVIIEHNSIEEKHIIYGTMENACGKYLLNLDNKILYHPQNPYDFKTKVIKVYFNTEDNIHEFIAFIKTERHTTFSFYELFISVRIITIAIHLLITKMDELNIKYKINHDLQAVAEQHLPMDRPSYFWEEYSNNKQNINYLNFNNKIPKNPPTNYKESKINWMTRLSKNNYCLNCSETNQCQLLMPTISKDIVNYKYCLWK